MNYKRKTLLLAMIITIFSLVFMAISACRSSDYEMISVGEPLAPFQSSEIPSEEESGDENSSIPSSSITSNESKPATSSSSKEEGTDNSTSSENSDGDFSSDFKEESSDSNVSSSDDFKEESSDSNVSSSDDFEENESEKVEPSDSSSVPDKEQEEEHKHTPATLEGAEGTCIWRGLTEGSYCTSCEEILTEQQETDYGTHFFEEYVCVHCGLLELQYTFDRDNYEDIGYDSPYYICSAPANINISDVHRIVIPDTYMGYAVACIEKGAFTNFYGLYSLEIGKNVISIGKNALTNCPNLVEIYDRSSVQISKNTNFAKQAKAVYYQTYDSNITQSRDGFVTYKNGEEVLLIGYDGKAVDVVIPDGVTTIHPYTFANNDTTKTITIPSSVGYIYGYAFFECLNLGKIIFNNPLGWECALQETGSWMPISEDLSDPIKAFEVFTGVIKYYYRKES